MCWTRAPLTFLTSLVSILYESFLFQHLYTSSPFSASLDLKMDSAPPGGLPTRPDPNVYQSNNGDVSVNRNTEEAGMVWVVGPIIAALGLSVSLVLLFVIKK